MKKLAFILSFVALSLALCVTGAFWKFFFLALFVILGQKSGYIDFIAEIKKED